MHVCEPMFCLVLPRSIADEHNLIWNLQLFESGGNDLGADVTRRAMDLEYHVERVKVRWE